MCQLAAGRPLVVDREVGGALDGSLEAGPPLNRPDIVLYAEADRIIEGGLARAGRRVVVVDNDDAVIELLMLDLRLEGHDGDLARAERDQVDVAGDGVDLGHALDVGQLGGQGGDAGRLLSPIHI